MRFSLSALYCVVYLSGAVFAQSDNEVGRGRYPYMAYIYFSDDTILDSTGARFQRSAVLIKPQWLLSSAIDTAQERESLVNFQKKTLLARLGAISVDANFTINEDEGEQLREVVQIVQPRNHSMESWWNTDVSLMKVLLSFNLTTTVNVRIKRDTERTCIFLVFVKLGSSEDKTLMRVPVDLLTSNSDTCGAHYVEKTMACGMSNPDRRINSQNFCYGNTGGPLICDNEITGIQTYVDQCKPPHLYQLLTAWDDFITCGTKELCNEDKCSSVCKVTDKDPPELDALYASGNSDTDAESIVLTESPETINNMTQLVELKPTRIASLPSVTATSSGNLSDVSTTTITPMSEVATSLSTIDEFDANQSSPWPNEKPNNRRHMDNIDDMIEADDRRMKLEAQLQQDKKPYSAADRNQYLPQTVFMSSFILFGVI